jgi:Family of unknown function (DUF5682)
LPLLAHTFGVRHFSPAGALHLRRFLDEVQPAVVLIEGPADATLQLKHLVHEKTRPPVAVLAFTRTRPVRTIVYPLAAYSPEWVALRWALEHHRSVRFVDLPAAVFLELHRREEEAAVEVARAAAVAGAATAPAGEGDAEAHRDDTLAYLDDPYEAVARLSGEVDHATWWERHFEHTRAVAAYQESLHEFGSQLRRLEEDFPREIADPYGRHMAAARRRETLIREAYMRRQIRQAVTDPGSAVVVCGAFHSTALTDELPAMTDAEEAALPRTDCVVTLMPYSYPRLSAQSGYGAGNHAPSYFEAMFEEGALGTPERLPARYLSDVARRVRKGGHVRSAADVIEAVRLAEGLAHLGGGSAPTLRDLRDAAVTLLGQGERFPIEKALREVEIGLAIGALPPGVVKTALQDDFHQTIENLGLARYLVDEAQALELDLREDRRARSADAAFRDRGRSTFLHRLAVLDIGFAIPGAREQRGTAKEKWTLRWTPECEIRLAEGSLLADSIEACAAFVLAEKLATAADVSQATEVLLQAAHCELADALAVALRRVHDLAVDDGALPSIAKGMEDVAELVRYGNVRDVDPAPLRPILSQLYLRATLILYGACVCDDDGAKGVRAAMDRVQEATFLAEDELRPEPWIDAVAEVSRSDDRNAFLSGYATALLVERGRIADEALDAEVSRRLSPGTDASVGVNWFEGLVQRNRAALFMRRPLWACLARYVDELDDDAYRRALLYLRRAFSTFDPGEVRRVVSLLAAIWQPGDVQQLAREVEKTLDAAEIQKVADDLGDLDGL